MRGISWGRALLGAIAAEAGQVAATFAWVAFYSHVVNPGQPFAVYERHAAFAGPWVSIFAGALIFYAASRWIARSIPTALALFAMFVVVDVAILAAMSQPAALASWPVIASYLTKLIACRLGGGHARPEAPAEAA